MQHTFTQPAPDGMAFAADAFDVLVGLESEINRSHGNERFPIRVVAVAVAGDGRSVEFTVDTDAEMTKAEEALVGFALVQRRTM